jgi:hypothetical protein
MKTRKEDSKAYSVVGKKDNIRFTLKQQIYLALHLTLF